MTRRPALRCCRPFHAAGAWRHQGTCAVTPNSKLTDAQLAELRHPSGEARDEGSSSGRTTPDGAETVVGTRAGEGLGPHDPIGCDEPECQDLVRGVLVTVWPDMAAHGLSPKHEEEIDDGRPY